MTGPFVRVPFTVIDGGLSTALEAAGHDLNHPLWTARLLLDAPAAIVAAHLAYVRAGADVVITASYQASEEGFAALGVGAEVARDALASTTALARAAIAAATSVTGGAVAAHAATEHAPLVAASVGPYGAVLADGSEYRGQYDRPWDEIAAFHERRLSVLLPTGPDLLAVETMPTAREAAEVVAVIGQVSGRDPMLRCPAWVTFTCRDGARTWGGDRIEDAVGAVVEAATSAGPGAIAGVGVNCTAPEHVTELLRRCGEVTDLPLLAYPNRGQQWDGLHNRWRGAAREVFAPDLVRAWRAAGAVAIGGCCGVGPSAIGELAVQRATGRAPT